MMPKFSSLLFFCVAFYSCTSYETIKTRNDAYELLKVGLKEYLTTGNKPQYFKNALKSYQLPHFFREDPAETFDNVQLCTLCNLVVDLFVGERMLGMQKETFMEEAEFLCTSLGIENERVCQGVIAVNVDTFLYIIDNYLPFLPSNRVCGSVLQSYECPPGADFEWAVEIPPKDETKVKSTINKFAASNFSILHLSDIHYDPLYKPGGNANCGEPICCQDDQGDAEAAEDVCGYWTDYRAADAPWHLIEETVRQAKTHEFDLVYYTGDIISHRVWDTSEETNERDIAKIYTLFKDSFDVPVFAVFGNHEPHPLNVWTSEEVVSDDLSVKWLFELAAQHWSALVGEDVSESVLKGGYYSASPKPGFRVIGINSNLCYTDNWWLIFSDVDPFNQLQWLADTLKTAEDNGESVHILTHVPTGSSGCLKVWSREYKKIVERFSDTITGQFNGHTHKDEFHVYYSSSNTTEAISVAFNGASVTPFSDSNPSYKIYYVEENEFTLLDYDEWTFNLTLANSKEPTELPEWYKLYTFTEAYGVQDLTPTQVNQVLYAMTEDHSLLEAYSRFHVRNGDRAIQYGCNEDCQKGYLCDIAQSQFGDNTQCDYFTNLYDENNSRH